MPADDGQAPTEVELQRSSAVFLVEMERLIELERRKLAMAEGEAGRSELAREIEGVAAGLVGMSRYQTRLVDAGAAEPDPGRSVHDILVDWRNAERAMHDARLEFELAIDAADRLRLEHRRAIERQRPLDEG